MKTSAQFTSPRNFTLADTQPHAGHLGLFVDQSELVSAPTWWQEQGLQQTASGYGRKLNSGRKIIFEGRLYRIYVTQFSNAGSCWFMSKGRKIFVN